MVGSRYWITASWLIDNGGDAYRLREGLDEGAGCRPSARAGGVGDGGALGEHDHRGEDPGSGAPLGEGHAELVAVEAGEGALAGVHAASELGKGAGLVQVLFDEAAGVGQSLVAGRWQGNGLGCHAALSVAQHFFDVPGLRLFECGAGERDEQFAHQGADGDDRRAFGVEQGRPPVGGEADRVEATLAVEAVARVSAIAWS